MLRDGVVNDRLGVDGVLGLVNDRLGVDGALGLGVGRLILGDEFRVWVLLREKVRLVPRDVLRLIWIRGWVDRLMRGPIDRVEGLEDREKALLLREGRLRCGVDRMERLGVEREIDGLDVDRLGAERVTCLLDELLLRELRDDRWASAAEATSKATNTATAAPTSIEWDFFFVEYIKGSPFPGGLFFRQPGAPLPASPPAPNTPSEITVAPGRNACQIQHKPNYQKNLRLNRQMGRPGGFAESERTELTENMTPYSCRDPLFLPY